MKMHQLAMTGCAIAVAIGAVLPTQGGELCAGASEAVVIDLTVGTRTAAASETIRYSTAWGGWRGIECHRSG